MHALAIGPNAPRLSHSRKIRNGLSVGGQATPPSNRGASTDCYERPLSGELPRVTPQDHIGYPPRHSTRKKCERCIRIAATGCVGPVRQHQGGNFVCGTAVTPPRSCEVPCPDSRVFQRPRHVRRHGRNSLTPDLEEAVRRRPIWDFFADARSSAGSQA